MGTLATAGYHMGIKTKRLQIQCRATDDGRCARSKHVESLKNFGIINSITKLHLVGISTKQSTVHGFMGIKFKGLPVMVVYSRNMYLNYGNATLRKIFIYVLP